VARELQLDVAGIDILFDEDGYRVCEANSSPGFQGLERACGVDVPETVFLAMGRKFGLAVRHSERWERAIERAAKKLAPRRLPAKTAARKRAPVIVTPRVRPRPT
jgi:gamma-F420-2:alpha-L-glutamate ligase